MLLYWLFNSMGFFSKITSRMLFHLREDYQSQPLNTSEMEAEPANQLRQWFQDALSAGVREPNAMTLATATPDGKPSARIVLLKDFGPEGFSFFTNYQSRKGSQLKENPHVALVFLWHDLHRQVRIEGQVERLSAEASEAYFQNRPRGSQVGAWASPQSSVLDGREWLEQRIEAVEKQYEGLDKLPLPGFWGGYLVKPAMFEFWQGQTSRLHDRFRYSPKLGGGWLIERLAP